MIVKDIYEILDSISPFALQASWDNSGLNIGSLSMSFKQVYISLELDWQVLNCIDEFSLLIVHHPLIFKPLKTLDTNTYPSNLIAQCLKKNIAVIAMHTNFDLTHLNKTFANSLQLEELGFTLESSKEFSLIYINTSKKPIALDSIATHIKNKLKLDVLRYSKGFDFLQSDSRIFITCGSNAPSHCIANKNDCVITGDIKYHDAMIANSNNVSFIDVPHFESEYIFATLLAETLQKSNIQAIIANSHNPFCYI
ncbi:Nif3-like dinuclear metal center hexameric protein [Helicobacter muridarum]|uniref:GTP cyclohydrolase 1 type 2 homolog n=1 Tax=Helicobacter muridarum TaxID=216 RepID=A0A099U1Z6_9HELI|nr:Nif3-like dinuclear metal center hexameric protein [Helicobacter muridarum]TLE01714.1 Nif3-like dinuclear metal center hexameric protein [Helicobacter muridarum]STQ86359.1 NIF3 family protein [Helicobacter muridarum]